MRDTTFERLYEEHAPGLLGFLAYRVGDRGLAEDLLADTFERVLRRRAPFDPRRGTEKAWIYSIALNHLRDHLRRRQAEERAGERVVAAAGAREPRPLVETIEERQTVLQALDLLAAEEREAVALRFGGDLSVPEVARVLGLPLTTVEGRVYRGLRKLRTSLGDRA
jgi:RNA polymerase sigma-70 factor (ECF subfamily)